ncbi:MAG: hypothetical protein AAGH64_04070, partial [Planctomycetota bacterium]
MRDLPVGVRAEQLERFGSLPGADEEPWDLLLSTTATDEHAALEELAKRTGVEFVAEPRLEDSSESYYERVPPSAARRHLLAGLRTENGVMVVATSQPMQPASFTRSWRCSYPRLMMLPTAALGESTIRKGPPIIRSSRVND